MAGKKKTLTASEQDEDAREEWREESVHLNADDLIVVDETRATVTMTRRYARAPGGARAHGSVPRNHGTGTTLVAALTTQGIAAPMVLEGALDTAACVAYVREVLCPELRPGQIVLMDNLNVHKAEDVRRLIEDAGCRLLFLPAYSPDLSPIELAFSKIKEALRAAGARTQEALIEAIKHAIDLVTSADALAFFSHCGYSQLAKS